MHPGIGGDFTGIGTTYVFARLAMDTLVACVDALQVCREAERPWSRSSRSMGSALANLDWVLRARGYAPATAAKYATCVTRFLYHVGRHRIRQLRDDDVVAYLDYVIKNVTIQRHRFIRELFALSRKVTEQVFAHTAQRALRYRILDMATVERIAWFCMSQGEERVFDVDVDDNYCQRPAYLEGCLTDEPDLSIYDDLLPSDSETNATDEEPDSEEEQDHE